MNVLGDIRSLESSVESENVLLTGLTSLSRNLLFYSVAIVLLHSLKSLDVSRESCDGSICDRVGEILEVWSS